MLPHLRCLVRWPRRAAVAGLVLGTLGGALLAAAGPPAAEPDADLADGRAAYERCAVCHGPDGAGRTDGTFPKIAGQYRSVVFAQLVAIRSGARPNPVMEPHAQALTDDRELEDVAAYVASLPKPAAVGLGPGDRLERGGSIYRRTCAGCHGVAGEGDAEQRVPYVAGQHYAYLLRRVRSFASWGPQSDAHPATEPPLAGFTDAELQAVVDYAGRLPATEESPPAVPNRP